jgi:hypothetical protein
MVQPAPKIVESVREQRTTVTDRAPPLVCSLALAAAPLLVVVAASYPVASALTLTGVVAVSTAVGAVGRR